MYGISARSGKLGLIAVCALALAMARNGIAQQAFEVASIKPSSPGPNGLRGSCHGTDSVYTPGQQETAPPLGRCVITDARLSHLVYIAWKIDTMQRIHSGPTWIAAGDERFDVVAKAEDPLKTTESQLLVMLQNLLIERFHMRFHRESVDTSGFALTTTRTGSKLVASKSQDTEWSVKNGKPAPGQPVFLTARRCSMAMLVNFLSAFGGQGPGIDKTGLDGVYDFTLAWDDTAGPSLSTALREQLGLRMESQKVPVSNFVIDSAQRPTAN